MRAKMAAHPIEEIGAKLRAMMPWIKQRALVDKKPELMHGFLWHRGSGMMAAKRRRDIR